MMKKTTFLAITTILCVSFSAMADVSFRGYISQGYLISDRTFLYTDMDGGTFDFGEAGLATYYEEGGLSACFEISTRMLGETGGFVPSITQAFANYKVYGDYLDVRFGIQKLPVGLENENRDKDMQRVSIFLPLGVHSEMNRDFMTRFYGISLSGKLWRGKIQWQLSNGNDRIDVETSTYGLQMRQNFGVFPDDITPQFIRGAKLYIDPIDWLTIGYTCHSLGFKTMTTDFPALGVSSETEIKQVDGHTFSLKIARPGWSVQGEYQMMPNLDTDMYIPIGAPATTIKGEYKAWYAQAVKEIIDKLHLSYYHSELRMELADVETELNDDVVSIRYDIKPTLISKVEYHFLYGNAYTDDTSGNKKHFGMTAVKLTYCFF